MRFCSRVNGIKNFAISLRCLAIFAVSTLKNYSRNDVWLYAKLLPYQPTAIANAGRLEATYSQATPPAERNPCTTVHHLVQRLNEHRRP